MVVQKNELTHWGIKGQKWGIRRYQNEDGTLTAAGKQRYKDDVREAKDAVKAAKRAFKDTQERGALARLGGYSGGPKIATSGKFISRERRAEQERLNDAYKKAQENLLWKKAELKKVKGVNPKKIDKLYKGLLSRYSSPEKSSMYKRVAKEIGKEKTDQLIDEIDKRNRKVLPIAAGTVVASTVLLTMLNEKGH